VDGSSSGVSQVRSRNDKSFDRAYPGIVEAPGELPNETVIDGEVVALDESGRPSFSALQNYGSSHGPIFCYVFDVLVLEGRKVMADTLATRPSCSLATS
jgi:ATP-dependent DNA ligase